ncbi:MAG TPA: hypothetical protein PKA28_17705 [Methylomusa anaerophila]|uniref:Uncharacterized protein n=1 Tax=Methylomusa anaerophila TaxID=1930071 RepID=A0A348AMG3_9FIRM|nr:hypothetical protein [Methylomusa anaerophila]BBB92261.1 hypothetical protein MAMMFC1_02946 [Methylomusa anaerophila]HML90280.1 hypothetical protein [Methylomusa anaerophila]
MFTFWAMIVIAAYGILSGIIIISTIVVLGHFDLLPNQAELVGKALLIWGGILLVYSYVLHTLTMFMLQPLINFTRKKVRELPYTRRWR